MKIVLKGIPIAKIRARTVSRGSFIQTYDPQEKEKRNIALEIMTQTPKNPHTQKISIDMIFHMPYPKVSTSNVNLLRWAPNPPMKDIDNLVKFYLDCANGVLWHDDRQIVELKAKKLYSDNPRTEIFVDTKAEISLKAEIEKILGIYGPDEVKALLSDLEELRCHFNIWSASKDRADLPEPVLQRIAWLLSRFAEKHDPMLRKITKHCPKYWEKSGNKEEQDVSS